MKFKKIFLALLCGVPATGLAGCGSSGAASSSSTAASSAAVSISEQDYASIPKPQGNDNTVSIGVTPIPHGEIVNNVVKPEMEKAGWKVKVVEFNDYVQPNTALSSGDIDANYYQTTNYLAEANKKQNLHLVSVAAVHLEPMGLYSKTMKSLSELKDGSTIAVPNDSSNESRAIRLLAENGLFKIDSSAMLTAKDITENPHKFKIMEVDAANLARTLDDVDAAVINSNYALQAKFNPTKDAIIKESSSSKSSSQYFNDLVVKQGNENTEKTKALKVAITSKAAKEYIEKKYKGAVIPTF